MNATDAQTKPLEPKAAARAAVLLTDTAAEFLSRVERSLPNRWRLALAAELDNARSALRKPQYALFSWVEGRAGVSPSPAAYDPQVVTNCRIAHRLVELLAKMVADAGMLPLVTVPGETFWDAASSLADLAKRLRTVEQPSVE
ncbi:MAG: hypothetical protein ACUVWX_14745 [Kiritimatiellia bacterium]